MRLDIRGLAAVMVLAATLAIPATGHAQLPPGKVDPDGLTMDAVRKQLPEYFHPATGANGRVQAADIPDVFGPGAVLRVGNVHMKVTNLGSCGNFFTNLSTDPSGQWIGTSGIEYLSTIRFMVGAVNPTATDPNSVRRVSYFQEWRPKTLEVEDKIYRGYDGIINGTRFVNDDHDNDGGVDPYACDSPPCPRIDEDFLDGRDNDGDGQVDEDYGAVGQEMYSCAIWDNTIQAINSVFNEKHIPIGLEVRQKAWAYSVVGFQDFDVIEYEIFNRSGHMLDSVYVGWLVDMDAGPLDVSNFFNDDYDVPTFPQGEYYIQVGGGAGMMNDPLRAQGPSPGNPTKRHDQHLNGTVTGGRVISDTTALCPVDTIRINGFSIIDDNGDNGKTFGIGSFLLVDHTVDPTGETAPRRVGFRAYRSWAGSVPYVQGGNPIIDQQKYEFISGAIPENRNIGDDGFINAIPGDQKGDYVAYCSIGPFLQLANNQSVTCTVAFAVNKPTTGDPATGYQHMIDWPSRLAQYKNAPSSVPQGSTTKTKNQIANEMFNDYPALTNAFNVQLAFEGTHEQREGFRVPDYHGRETPRQLPPGAPPNIYLADCHDQDQGSTRQLTDREPTWFDFDCSYCTGVWDYSLGSTNAKAGGLFHKTWNAEAPPPNPNLNVAANYNYTDNPDRKVAPAGDKVINLAWDNLSEVTADPKSQWFDFRGYRVWKVADWRRPVGAAGPSESDWTLVGEYRQFNYRDQSRPDLPLIPNNLVHDPGSPPDSLHCPLVFIPNYYNPKTGVRDSATVPLCLFAGDLWDHQTGQVIRPDTSQGCMKDSLGNCIAFTGTILQHDGHLETRVRYPIGEYTFRDNEVKNGFIYFYSVTAFDSTTTGNNVTTELSGRRSSVESEGVVPQVSTGTGNNVWVVPNPYRGYADISKRPSSWDLTPNASDPTGTHIDFMGLPSGRWTIRIYTVSGDLVQVLHSEDSVNESVRVPVTDEKGISHPGYNRQQDSSHDGQARWNLISRNGQDIVSGIYVFTVESSEKTQRGRFVVIR